MQLVFDIARAVSIMNFKESAPDIIKTDAQKVPTSEQTSTVRSSEFHIIIGGRRHTF